MGLEALYPRRRTSQPGKGHKIYPYLLRDLTIDRPNQVWATDITYVPMAKGFMYLVAIMDWHSRRVLSWRVVQHPGHRLLRGGPGGGLAALWHARDLQHRPGRAVHLRGVHRRAQGRTASTISMDGKGRWVDNVFVERLWRSVKYEDVYLRAYETPAELRAGLSRYFEFYNTRRRHSALDRRTPDAVYFDQAAPDLAA